MVMMMTLMVQSIVTHMACTHTIWNAYLLSVERLYEHDDLNLDGLEDEYQLQVAEAEKENAEPGLAVEETLPDDEPRNFEGKFLFLFLYTLSYNL